MTKEEIKSVSIELFRKISFSKTSVSDIARACNIGKGTVYLYFKCKEDIFYEIMSDRFTQAINHNRSFYNDENIDLLTKLDTFLENMITEIFEIKDLMFGSFDNFEGKILKDIFIKTGTYFDKVQEILLELTLKTGLADKKDISDLKNSIMEFLDVILGRIILHLMRYDWDDEIELKKIIKSLGKKLFKSIILN